MQKKVTVEWVQALPVQRFELLIKAAQERPLACLPQIPAALAAPALPAYEPREPERA